MTETQPEPQVVAWMRRHLRDNPGASRVDLMRGYRNTDSSVSLRELNDAAEAVLYPQSRTVADIPAGQGPASLFIAGVRSPDDDEPPVPSPKGQPWLWFKDVDGTLYMVEREPTPMATAYHWARWDHLAATLPRVTAEETP